MRQFILLLLSLVLMPGVRAEIAAVAHWSVDDNLETVYEKIHKSMEENKLFIVFEPNMGRNLARHAERWGEDYNRNRLGGIRSMVFCSAWYANQLSNIEPLLLSLCPMHLTLYQQGDETHVVFLRPSVIARGTPAASLLGELEADVENAVQQGVAPVNTGQSSRKHAK